MEKFKISKESYTPKGDNFKRYLNEVDKTHPLSPNEEEELFLKFKQGDEKAREKLIKSNLRFVVSVAKNYQNRGLDIDDLVNEGNIGLMRALDRFDPTKGFKLISYAVWWIRQSILEAINKNKFIRPPENNSINISKIKRISERFEADEGREPSERELEELSKILVKNSTTQFAIDLALQDWLSGKDEEVDVVSLNDHLGEDTGELIDDIPGYLDTTDTEMETEFLREKIKKYLDFLNKEERIVVEMSYGLGEYSGKTPDLDAVIAETLGKDKQQVQGTRRRAIEKIQRRLKKKKII